MRTASLAFIVSLLFSIPIAARAELPDLGDNFPKGWKKIDHFSCTTKAGEKIKTEKYMQSTENKIKVIELFYKNGTLYAQIIGSTNLANRNHDLQVFTKNNPVFSVYNPARNPTKKDFDKMDAMIFEALGITDEEAGSCLRE